MKSCNHLHKIAAFLVVLAIRTAAALPDAQAASLLMTTDGQSSSNNSKASALGHSVTTDTLANIVATPVPSLNTFDVVWINPGLSSSGYSNLRSGVANGGALEQYVVAGGTLVINVAGNSGNQSDIAPGSVDYDRSTTHGSEVFTSPLHPYLTGSGYDGHMLSLSDFYNWSSTDHGQLENLVVGTTTVLSNTDGPSFVEYVWGSGTVLLNTLTYGWGSGGAKGKPQDNLINYASSVFRLRDSLKIEPPEGFVSSGDQGGPFTPPCKTYTLTNDGPNSLDWTAAVTEAWLGVTPSAGTLAGGASTTVDVRIDSNANTLPTGVYNDIVTVSNLTSGVDQTRIVELLVGTTASVPFVEDFEGGPTLNPYWEITGTNNYRTQVTTLYGPHGGSYHVTMDSTSGYSRNELTLTVNLENYEDVMLTFWAKEFAEEPQAPPVPFFGGWDFDGVAVSEDGYTWYEVQDLRYLSSYYTQLMVDLDSAIAGYGLTYNHIFRIRFNQYDNSSISADGIAIDDIEITGQLKDDLVVAPAGGLVTSGPEKGPFTPSAKSYTLTNAGPNSLDWTATVTQHWLDVEPNRGTINPGDSNVVEVFPTADANALLPGDYDDILAFTNTASGLVQTRDVLLEVTPVPVEMEVTDSIPPIGDLNMPFGDVIIGLSSVGQITLTNTDPNFSLVVADISLGGAYFEDFNDGLAQDWYEDVDNSWEVVSGEYRAQRGLTDFMFSKYLGREWGDLSVQVSCRRDGGPYNAATVVLRATSNFDEDIGSAYVFQIATDGDYGVWKQVNGSWSWLQSWTYSPAINPGTNVLTATAEANVLKFFVNGMLVWTGTDNSLMSGYIGVGGYTDFGDATHYFDDVLAGELAETSHTLSPEQQWYNENAYDGGSPRVTPTDWEPPQYPGQPEVRAVHSANLWANGFRLENVPNLPAIVPPMGSMIFDVNFSPQAAEECESAVVIKCTDANESEVTVRVTGRGILDYLEIIPDANLEFSGHPRGPFVPTYQYYRLTNIGPISIDWVVDEPNWLDVHPSSGVLTPDESATVTVSPNYLADTKGEGAYSGEILFIDSTTTLVQIRNVILDVYIEPKIWVSPHSFNVTVPRGGTATRTLTVGNGGDAPLGFTLSGRETNFVPLAETELADIADAPTEDLVVSISEQDFAALADVPCAEGELLVRFAPQAEGNLPATAERNAILANLGGGTVAREYELVPGLCLVELAAGMAMGEALVSLNQAEGIIYAQPNYELTLDSDEQYFPSDPSFDVQWNMHNFGQNGGTPDADIDAPEAWDIATGSNQVVVAVIDTGVDYTHPDLTANMWVNEAELNGTPGADDDNNGYVDDIYGYDFCTYGQPRDPDPMDDYGHGTHCAGIIGAVGNNYIGVAGVCWNVRIMALKWINWYGNGYTSDAIEAIQYSTLMRAKVSSNSWRQENTSIPNPALEDAITSAGEAGALFIASAGNDSTDNDIWPHYPSSYECDNIVAVSSTDRYDNLSYFSNYGLNSVDLGAPGSDIFSCVPGGWYDYGSGTSMAAPHVAGACALLWSTHPSLSHLHVKDIVLETVDPLPALAGLCVSGGRLNLYNALLEVQAQWLEFVPDSGTVAPDTTNDVNVVFIAEQAPGTYEGYITVGSDDPYTSGLTLPVTMTIEAVDYFTELFDPLDPNDPNCNDMAYRTLTLKPGMSLSYYKACIDETTDFPVEPNGGTIMLLGDDDYEQVDLLYGADINFHGTGYNSFFVGSNGYITFVSGDTHYVESFLDQFDLPRISALFDDLDPTAGGTVSWKQLSDRVAVTFENVPEFSLGNTNSFQIEMFFNGTLRITWLEITACDGLVGVSNGGGLSPYFSESDLSEYNLLCDPDDDCDTDFEDLAILAACWQKRGDMETVRDEFNTVSYSGNDGTQNWSNEWHESGESDGPSAGLLQVVSSGSMRVGHENAKDLPSLSLTREADLSVATMATLTFDYSAENSGNEGSVSVRVSSNGGSNWNTLAAYPYHAGSGFASFDITSYISSNTQVRFEIDSQEKIKMYLYVDNVQIEYDNPQRPWYRWCDGADVNKDFRADFDDLLVFVEHWLE